jgi:predicted metal-dependent phosphoesterase TrpH
LRILLLRARENYLKDDCYKITMKKIDLQVHTLYSDGGKSAEYLIREAHSLDHNIGAIAFTDHDNKGFYTWPGIARLVSQLHSDAKDGPKLERVADLQFARCGLEMHAEPIDVSKFDASVFEQGWPMLRYRSLLKVGAGEVPRSMLIIQATEIKAMLDGKTVDLLAYFVPAKDNYFDEKFASQIMLRNDRAAKIVSNLRRECGMPQLTMGDVHQAQSDANYIMIPHIASAILNLTHTGVKEKKIDLPRAYVIANPDLEQLVDSRQALYSDHNVAIINKYLNANMYEVDGVIRGFIKRKKPGYAPMDKSQFPDAREAVENLLEIGAVPVLPYSSSLDMSATYKRFQEWGHGLVGLEVWNMRHMEVVPQMKELAAEHNCLAVTAGSDHHAQKYDGPDRKHLGVELDNAEEIIESLIKHRLRIIGE